MRGRGLGNLRGVQRAGMNKLTPNIGQQGFTDRGNRQGGLGPGLKSLGPISGAVAGLESLPLVSRPKASLAWFHLTRFVSDGPMDCLKKKLGGKACDMGTESETQTLGGRAGPTRVGSISSKKQSHQMVTQIANSARGAQPLSTLHPVAP